MKARIADYQKLHPGVKIKLVPQSTDTLIGAFTTAAQTKSGPDIATQWATIPVLSQAWAGAVAPVSDYVSASQRSQWIGTQENTDQGKLYAVPLYVIGVPLAYNKALFAKANITDPPRTFDDLLSDCRKLKAAGITPIGMGNKDGYFGAWFWSNFGKQNLDSTEELKQAVIGKADITDPKYTGLYEPMHQLKSNGCLNDDIASLTLDQGMAKFGAGQAAMAWGTDGIVNGWAQKLGADKVAITTTPKWGTGKLADVYNTTQSSSAFITSWSKNKKAAAQFLMFLHEPKNLKSWYEATGIFPADKQFQPSSIKDDLGKQMWDLDSSDGAVWLENYLPPSVDGDGNLAAGQVITSGGSVAEAVDTFRKATEKWRSQNPVEVKNYTAWAAQ
ncbi:ABC transporter substrate-binding protein [Nocardioides panacis]|uniref:ABC transporter substrate-binding protein n=1 Tax=Nocardioides panacis TaxID=2849501 RepID=UPI00265F72B2|nr:extracellular solute-binding protein [Nocardioides panacis]